MIVIGTCDLLFDITYLFGRQAGNHYIKLPLNCPEEEAFRRFALAVKANPGEVLICTQAQRALERYLRDRGLRQSEDYYLFTDLKAPFVAMLRRDGSSAAEEGELWRWYERIFFSPHGRFLPCQHPLYEAEIADSGNVHTCCSAIMPNSIGNIQGRSFRGIWHSVRARLIRLSALNGTAVFCAARDCQFLRRCDERYIPVAEQLSDFPLILNIAVDSSCNLSCPSCRTRPASEDDESSRQKARWLEQLEEALFSNLRDLYVAGNGECTISRVYIPFLLDHVMRHYSGNLHLLTNGQVWNVQMLNALTAKFVPEVLISVDAWEKDTYESIRRGGQYGKLTENIRRYVRLRRQGRLSRVTVRFVVQAANYLEIPRFIENMRAMGVDRLEFSRLVKGSAIQPDAFEAASLLDADGRLRTKYRPFFRENVWPLLAEDVSMDRAYLPIGLP